MDNILDIISLIMPAITIVLSIKLTEMYSKSDSRGTKYTKKFHKPSYKSIYKALMILQLTISFGYIISTILFIRLLLFLNNIHAIYVLNTIIVTIAFLIYCADKIISKFNNSQLRKDIFIIIQIGLITGVMLATALEVLIGFNNYNYSRIKYIGVIDTIVLIILLYLQFRLYLLVVNKESKLNYINVYFRDGHRQYCNEIYVLKNTYLLEIIIDEESPKITRYIEVQKEDVEKISVITIVSKDSKNDLMEQCEEYIKEISKYEEEAYNT